MKKDLPTQNTGIRYAHRFPVRELEKSVTDFYKDLGDSGALDLIHEEMQPMKPKKKTFHDNVQKIVEKEKLLAKEEEIEEDELDE